MSNGGRPSQPPISRIEDLCLTEVEHLLGLATGLPLVKLRVQSDKTVIVGQMSPTEAREIATNLTYAAARAEYEHDLVTTARLAGWEDEVTGGLLLMVREGEERRLGA